MEDPLATRAQALLHAEVKWQHGPADGRLPGRNGFAGWRLQYEARLPHARHPAAGRMLRTHAPATLFETHSPP